jgi:ribose 1,5-bisphosphokinase PhnN
MSAITIQQMADRVADLLDDRLQASGTGLAAKLKKVGRQLPRQVREAATRLARAARDAQNPRLLMRIDEGAVATDYDLCVRHLTAIAPGTGFLRALLRIAASVGIGLLVLGLVFLALRTAF